METVREPTFDLWGKSGIEAHTFLTWVRGKTYEGDLLQAASDPCPDLDWGVLPRPTVSMAKPEWWHFRADGRVLIKIRPLCHYATLELVVLVLSSETRWAARLEEFRTQMYEARGPEAVHRRLEASDPGRLLTERTDVRV